MIDAIKRRADAHTAGGIAKIAKAAAIICRPRFIRALRKFMELLLF
jgi:hypothetical protein